LYASHGHVHQGAAVGYIVSWTMIFFGIYLFNDVYDLPIDKINKPWKPIPRNWVSPGSALRIAIASLGVGSLGVTVTAQSMFLAPLWSIVSAVGFVDVLGVGYSIWIKRNCPVAANTVIVGVVAICGLLPSSFDASGMLFLRGLPVYVLGLLSREYFKDIEDEWADLRGGARRTLPIVYGRERAASVAWVLLAGSVVWAVVQAVSFYGVSSVAVAKYASFVVFSGMAICVADGSASAESSGRVQRWQKVGLLVFLLIDLMSCVVV